jgi:Peptidase A4 family
VLVASLLVASLLAGCAPSPVPSVGIPSASQSAGPASSASGGDGAVLSSTLPSSTPLATPFALHAGCPATAQHDGYSTRQRALHAATTNWSGYVARSTRAFTCIQASWIQPSVTCPTNGSASLAIWIGFDGETGPSRSTLEQIGTNTDCHDGRAESFAWFEILPHDKFEQPIDLDVASGDRIAASIRLVSHSYQLVIEDLTTGLERDTTQKSPNAKRLTAEWVVEAPTVGCPANCQVALLASFGTVSFKSARAILAGVTGPIGDARWTRVQLTLESRSAVVKAKPGSLGKDGASFAVVWHHR